VTVTVETYDRSMTAGEHAAGLDEGAHALSYAAKHVRNPGEVDRVAANLASAVGKFPRSFEALKEWLVAESQAGRIVDDGGPEAIADTVAAAEEALGAAGVAALKLQAALDDLHAHLAKLSAVPGVLS
jgi:hypothetical protein